MKLLSLDFYDWIARFAILNLLWLLCNFPGALMLYMFFTGGITGLVEESIVAGYFLTILCFFPATTALFCSVRDITMQREKASISKSYLLYVIKNFKQSVLCGTALTSLFMVWALLYYGVADANVVQKFFLLGTLIPVILVTIYSFIVISHFEIPFKQVMRKSLLLAFGSIKLSILIIIVCFVFFYVSVNGLYFLTLFFSASITAFVVFSMFYRYYISLMEASI